MRRKGLRRWLLLGHGDFHEQGRARIGRRVYHIDCSLLGCALFGAVHRLNEKVLQFGIAPRALDVGVNERRA